MTAATEGTSPMTAESIKLPSLTGRATAEFRKAQRKAQRAAAAEAKRAALRADIVVPDPAAVRAWEQWRRETAETRESAATKAEQILAIPANPDAWNVSRETDNVAKCRVDALELAVWPLLSFAKAPSLELGVRLAKSSDRFTPVTSLEHLGRLLNEWAPPRKQRSK